MSGTWAERGYNRGPAGPVTQNRGRCGQQNRISPHLTCRLASTHDGDCYAFDPDTNEHVSWGAGPEPEYAVTLLPEEFPNNFTAKDRLVLTVDYGRDGTTHEYRRPVE